MEKRVISNFILGLFSLLFPVVWVCDLFHRIFGSIFTFSEEKEDINLLERWWVKPCEKIINWGWKQTSLQNIAINKVVRFDSKQIGVGNRVRVVSMNGCMGHIKDNVREGVVIGFESKQIYGGGKRKYRYAKIKLDSGEVIERCAESRLWSRRDRLPEYQE